VTPRSACARVWLSYRPHAAISIRNTYPARSEIELVQPLGAQLASQAATEGAKSGEHELTR